MKNTSFKQCVDIRQDPFVKGLVARLPEQYRDSFDNEQLVALKIAMGARQWGNHLLDVRGTLGFWRWRYYYVVIGGRERRTLSRRQQNMARMTKLYVLALFLMFSALLGVLMIYLVKSAIGIDLIPGFSWKIWDWFNNVVL
ncbi:MAG: hypothetical protein OEM02_16100 [Desulfobulbaceae bacterium]|nr:hypothetical protein [Desulfobulbaceae bacterium]